MDNEKLEIAYEAETTMEAQAIMGILEEAGIPYTARSVGLSGLFGGSGVGAGEFSDGTQILVHAADKQRAEDLILNYSSED